MTAIESKTSLAIIWSAAGAWKWGTELALRAVADHPKLARLKSLLKCGRGEAMGYLEAMWHFAGRFTPQGNIGKYTDAEIEAWIEWGGAPGKLVEALTESCWLDKHPKHRLLVHDWHEHADDATRLAVKRKKLPFLTIIDAYDRQMSGNSNQPTDTIPTLSGLPEPVPEPVPEPEGDAREGAPPPIPRNIAEVAEALDRVSRPLESPPGENPEENIPEGLATMQYSAFVLECLPVAANYALKVQAGDAIELLAKTEQCTMAVATKRMLDRMRAAKRAGPVKWNFWLSEGGFTAEAQEAEAKANGSGQPSATKQRVSANREAVRKAAERRGWTGVATAGGADGRSLPQPGLDGVDGGVPGGLRSAGAEILPPTREGRSP